jgi:hypothetical protein
MSENQETVVEEVPKTTQPPPNAMTLSHATGEIVAKDTSELMRQIKMMMKGLSFSKSFDTPEKCISAWNLACSFKVVSPQRAIANMLCVHGVISIWGELPKALAEATGELEDFELFLIGKDYKQINFENQNLNDEPFAAICKIKRKGRTKNSYHFTVDDADRAGLLDKKGDVWKNYRGIMLKRRAQSEALKFEFSDALMGTNIAEYTFNHFPEAKDVSPESTGDTAKVLNNLFTDTETTPVN